MKGEEVLKEYEVAIPDMFSRAKGEMLKIGDRIELNERAAKKMLARGQIRPILKQSKNVAKKQED